MIFAEDKLKLVESTILDFNEYHTDPTAEAYAALLGCVLSIIQYERPEKENALENQG